MEAIPKDWLFEFNPDTLQYLRRQYDLDKPGSMDKAIDLLDDWIKKQNHFVIKEFPRDYLERAIIISKGSVERAKTKLDRICTFRTLFPDFFDICDVKNCPLVDDLCGIFLPKLTKEHYRVYMFKNIAKSFKSGFLDFYRYFFMQCEYLHAYDYCNGVVLVLDYTKANVLETVKWFNLNEFRDAHIVLKDGYGMRVKGIYFISESKAIGTLVSVFKQALSAKLAARVSVHKSMDSLNEALNRDILPLDYGGHEKSMSELHEKIKETLSSDNFIAYLNKARKACTDERLRLVDDEDNQYLGIQGSFRQLDVD